MLFGARRYAEARAAFQALQARRRGRRQGARRPAHRRVRLLPEAIRSRARRRAAVSRTRLAQGRSALLLSEQPPRARRPRRYIALTRALVAEFPDSSWSEEALNNLGTHYILTNEDDAAAKTFNELYEQVPDRRARGARGLEVRLVRATGTATTPRRCACSRARRSAFPRSDYRPSFLYWAARAHAKLGAGDAGGVAAAARLHRLRELVLRPARGASARARGGDRCRARRRAARIARPGCRPPDAKPIPTEPLIRLLLANGLYDDALERAAVRAARVGQLAARSTRRSPGPTTSKGELRRAITLMRRAYPQFLTAGGQQLPAEILAGHLPADLLGLDSQAVGAARSRSVPGRRADRAGVDLRSGGQVGRRMRGA